MIIQSMVVGPVGTNCYLLGDGAVCALIDPGDNARGVAEMVKASGMEPAAILLTHGHYDHRDAVPELLERYPGLPVYLHRKERTGGGPSTRYFYGGDAVEYGQGDTVSIGSLTVQVLETPGHTAGSVTLLADRAMFAGDTLFAGTCGRCDLPGGSLGDMFASLKRLALLEGDYAVYPGHGPATTLEEERRHNPYMRQAMTR